MTTETRVPDGLLPIAQLRAMLTGPTIARALYEERLPYYSQSVGSAFGLDPEGLVCALCGAGFQAPCFAIASVKASVLWPDDKRVGDGLLTFHKKCVRLAEETGQTFDEWMETMRRECDEFALLIARGGAE